MTRIKLTATHCCEICGEYIGTESFIFVRPFVNDPEIVFVEATFACPYCNKETFISEEID